MPPKYKGPGRPKGSKNKKTVKIEDRSKNYNENGHIRLICPFCNRSFATTKGINRHRHSCKGQNLSKLKPIQPSYHCNKCTKKFRFKASYRKHVLNEHSTLPGSVKCKQCQAVCPDENVLALHTEKVHNREIFQCEHCNATFVRRSHVERHLFQKGCDGRNVTGVKCEICGVGFSRKDNMMVHVRLQHIKSNHFYCKHCEYDTKNFSKLIIHTQKYHMVAQFECDHCGKTTSSRAAMSKHLEIHGQKKFSCDVCGYSTYTIEVIRRHVLTHVPDKPNKCPLCDRSYIQKKQLQRHMEKKHQGNRCVKCGETFESKAGLLVHENSEHTGLKQLVCPFENCPKSDKEYSSEESLQRHVKRHLESKEWACEVCHKRYGSEANMRRHMHTHALERPRRCMYCVSARAYVRGQQLVRHVRKSHPSVFRERLLHVRRVLGLKLGVERVSKSEMESILNVLDAESDRIIEDYGPGVLYGGLQELTPSDVEENETVKQQEEDSPLMSEQELAENLGKLLIQLIDKEMLECFGWPEESIDVVLEKVIENCGARVADRDMWSRVQRLRENAKHLFLYVIEDKNIARMFDTHTIDQIIKHILQQVSDADEPGTS